MSKAQSLAPNDWLAHPDLLPPRPLGLTEVKYIRRFAVDIHGAQYHDQYVFLAPNGLAIIGLAPSHPLVAAHRRAIGYQPTELRYIPPNVDHLKPEDLVSAAMDEEGQEDAEAGDLGQPGDGHGGAPPRVPDSLRCGSGAAESGTALRDRPSSRADQEDRLAAAGGDGRGGGRGGAPGGEATAKDGASGSGRLEPPPIPSREPFPPAQCARVNFEAGAARNQIGTKASGKKRGRWGPQQLLGGHLLAQVERRGGGASFPIWCAVKGQLCEINERLLKTPTLLYDRCAQGYLSNLSWEGEGAVLACWAASSFLEATELVCTRVCVCV
ncbi:hypothetical protein Vretimale_2216 [Volvox reticuliferus]|uniref:Uncharacterized protein n=1 Tax=Volvox reticuliferus TaxID=1737510 RepID=A0A8J4C5N2_9CHLO|nr:hypothetical protein Vretifemale_4516 [Volvox reticuliferus]GIL96358.1 hypothetical protein Vretimale_2216 [Volvox reticuliferus]